MAAGPPDVEAEVMKAEAMKTEGTRLFKLGESAAAALAYAGAASRGRVCH
jgi:hypothetical protein